MINLEGDGRENSDRLNRQTRLANNMLGAELDFIIRDLDRSPGVLRPPEKRRCSVNGHSFIWSIQEMNCP